MNTVLNAIDEEGNATKISLDLSLYEIEETALKTCILTHKADFNRWYEVISNFHYLHTLANGFDSSILN